MELPSRVQPGIVASSSLIWVSVRRSMVQAYYSGVMDSGGRQPCRSGRERQQPWSLARPSPLKVIGQRYGAGMLVRYRYRIYPSPGHQKALARAFGCTRVVFNDCLRLREACHAAAEKISDTEVQRRVITLAKSTPERAWLAEVASVPLVQACRDARQI